MTSVSPHVDEVETEEEESTNTVETVLEEMLSERLFLFIVLCKVALVRVVSVVTVVCFVSFWFSRERKLIFYREKTNGFVSENKRGPKCDVYCIQPTSTGLANFVHLMCRFVDGESVSQSFLFDVVPKTFSLAESIRQS